MSQAILDPALKLIVELFGHELGSPSFNIMACVCLLAWLVVARILMSMFSSRRGIFAAFFGLALPLVIGALAYGAATIYAVPEINAGWAAYLPLLVFGVVVFLAVLTLTRRVWALSSGMSMIIFVAASAAAVGAYFGAQVTMGVIEFGSDRMEERDKRVEDELESLL